MGVHPFGDPTIRDEFATEIGAVDARESHTYAAEWTPERVAFYVDDNLVKLVRQSPAYPMQFMLGIYEFRDADRALDQRPGRIRRRSSSRRFAATGPGRRRSAAERRDQSGWTRRS